MHIPGVSVVSGYLSFQQGRQPQPSTAPAAGTDGLHAAVPWVHSCRAWCRVCCVPTMTCAAWSLVKIIENCRLPWALQCLIILACCVSRGLGNSG